MPEPCPDPTRFTAVQRRRLVIARSDQDQQRAQCKAADQHLGEDPHHRKIHLMPPGMFRLQQHRCGDGRTAVEHRRRYWRRWCSRPPCGASNRPDVPPRPIAKPFLTLRGRFRGRLCWTPACLLLLTRRVGVLLAQLEPDRLSGSRTPWCHPPAARERVDDTQPPTCLTVIDEVPA